MCITLKKMKKLIKILDLKLKRKDLRCTPRHRYQDNMKMDFTEIVFGGVI
jgi:hypothetical protein